MSVTANSPLQSFLRPSPLKLTAHAVALFVVLLFALGTVWNGFSAFPDEGLYSLQAHQLTEGSWWGPRSAPDLDENGLYNNMVRAQVVDDGQLAYTQTPLYALLLTVGMFLFGPVGLMLVSLVGTWVASLGAALIAWEFKSTAAIPTLWLTGVGSPLLFGANIVLAHSLAAAGIAMFVAGLIRALKMNQPLQQSAEMDTTTTVDSAALSGLSLWHLAYALPALWFAIAIRSEATIVTAALGAALALLAVGRKPINWTWLLAAIATVVSGGIVYWLNTRWAAAISDVDGHGINPADVVLAARTGPADAMWTALLRPYIGKSSNFNLALAVVPVAALLGSQLLRISTWKKWTALTWIGTVTLAIAAGVSVYGAATHDGLISGLFSAFPLIGVAILWIRRSDIQTPAVAFGLLTLVFAAVGLLLTIYADGGAQQWGGRFFHILMPILCPLMVLFLTRLLSAVTGYRRHLTAISLAVLLLSYSVLSLRINAYRRDVTRDVIGNTIEFLDNHWPYPYQFALDGNHEGSFGDPHRPTVIFVRSTYDGFTRMAWQHTEGLELLTANGKARFAEVLDKVTQAGRDTIVVVANYSIVSFLNSHGDDIEILGWDIIEDEENGLTTTSRFLLQRNAIPAN